MADDVEQTSQEQTPEPEAEFDWEKFFLDEAAEAGSPPPAQAEAPVPETLDANGEEDEEAEVSTLKQEVEQLRKLVTDTAATTSRINQSAKVTTAIEAWKQQATPAELAMSDVLLESTSPEDLKQRAALIKRVTAQQDQVLAGEREKIERKLQKEFGLPVTPTFQPIPEKEKMDEALREGDIERAASLALKGVFNT